MIFCVELSFSVVMAAIKISVYKMKIGKRIRKRLAASCIPNKGASSAYGWGEGGIVFGHDTELALCYHQNK